MKDNTEAQEDLVPPPITGELGRTTRLPYRIILSLTPLIDATLVILTGLAVYLSYSLWNSGDLQMYVTALLVYSGLLLLSFKLCDLYDFDVLNTPSFQVTRIGGASLVVFSVMLGMGYAFKITDEFSRVWGFATFIGATTALYLYRHGFYILVQRSSKLGHIVRSIALVGCGDQALRLVKNMNIEREPWNRVVGVFDDRLSRVGSTFCGLPVLGTVDDLVRYARIKHLDDVVIALPWNAEKRITSIVNRLTELPVGIQLGADLAGYSFTQHHFKRIGGAPVMTVQRKPLDGWGGLIKAFEDRLFALLMIIVFSPVMALVALAIKLDSRGPLLYKQPRYGFNNRVFNVYKFRSMYVDRPPEEGVPQATRNDPRVTRVGRFIRRTSLDELPQLFNVLEGTMSLVGPRPHAVAHNEEYARIIAGYFARHRVKPGITGWAQVNGLRGETDSPDKMAARVRYDVYYIENWSLAFDLVILFRTAIVGFINKNAY